jgi:hypothetical protein
MTVSTSSGRVQLCVELALESHQTALAQHRQLNEIALRLLGQLDQWKFPATWAIDTLSESAIGVAIQQASVEHEIALLGTPQWLDPEHTRSQFQAELTARIEAARELSATCTSLVLHHTQLPSAVDLIDQQGIGVVRLASSQTQRWERAAQIKRTRGGLYLVSPNGSLPVGTGAFAALTRGFRSRQLIRTIAASGTTSHLSIQLNRLLTGSPRLMSEFDRALLALVDQRDAGGVQAETLASMYAHRELQLKSTPSRSILRAA